MKRTFLKKKSLTLRRKSLLKRPLDGVKRRKKSTSTAKLKKELWELCKALTRKQYGNTCYTCGKQGLTGSNWHTGHFIASSICGAYLRYDLRNLRPQCYRCNVSLVGNGAVFYRRMVQNDSQEYVDQLFADKERITKLTPTFLEEKIAEYKALLESA